jgi:hypothetical protein
MFKVFKGPSEFLNKLASLFGKIVLPTLVNSWYGYEPLKHYLSGEIDTGVVRTQKIVDNE